MDEQVQDLREIAAGNSNLSQFDRDVLLEAAQRIVTLSNALSDSAAAEETAVKARLEMQERLSELAETANKWEREREQAWLEVQRLSEACTAALQILSVSGKPHPVEARKVASKLRAILKQHPIAAAASDTCQYGAEGGDACGQPAISRVATEQGWLPVCPNHLQQLEPVAKQKFGAYGPVQARIKPKQRPIGYVEIENKQDKSRQITSMPVTNMHSEIKPWGDIQMHLHHEDSQPTMFSLKHYRVVCIWPTLPADAEDRWPSVFDQP